MRRLGGLGLLCAFALGCESPPTDGVPTGARRQSALTTVVATAAAFQQQGNDESNVEFAGNAVLRAAPIGGIGGWTATTPLPSARSSFGAATAGGYLYVVGGASGGTALATVLIAPAAGGAIGGWTSGPSLPSARRGAAAVVYGGYLYAVGGTDGTTALSEVQVARIGSN